MKKLMLGVVTLALAATSVMAVNNVHVKKIKAKQATCTS